PVSLDKTALCAKGSADAIGGAGAYTSPAFDFQGDSSVDAGTWIPGKPGCYRIDARVTTSDATPQASAAARSVVLTVLDSSSTLTLQHNVIGPGTFSARVVVAHSHALPGTTTITLHGPLQPTTKACSELTWSSAH